jgi:hypothetical protein
MTPATPLAIPGIAAATRVRRDLLPTTEIYSDGVTRMRDGWRST